MSISFTSLVPSFRSMFGLHASLEADQGRKALFLKNSGSFRICRLLLVILHLAVISLHASPLLGQLDMNHDTGVNPLEVYDSAQENVNIAGGNLNIQIPLVHLPGRNGSDFDLTLSYNSQQWTPIAAYMQGPNNPNYVSIGWAQEQAWTLGIPTLYFSGQSVYPTFSSSNNYSSQSCWGGFVLQSADGGRYSFPGLAADCWQTTTTTGSSGDGGAPPTGVTQTLPYQYIERLLGTDGSYVGETANSGSQGVVLDLTQFTNNVITARFKNGSSIVFNLPADMGTTQSPSGPMSIIASSIVDSNGNVITISQLNDTTILTDSLGRIITIAPGPSGIGQTVSYKNSNGASEQITLTGSSFYLKAPTPTFLAPAASNSIVLGGGVGISSGGPGWITLPNGLNYTFQYNEYGEVIKITYPWGGYTRYDYQAFPKAEYEWTSGVEGYADERDVIAKHVCRSAVTAAGATTPSGYVGSSAPNNCPVPEDTTTYSRTPTNQQSTAATVTDPFGNQTIYTFGMGFGGADTQNGIGLFNIGLNYSPLPTSKAVFQGTATLLQTVNTSYVDPSTNTASVLPFSETTILASGLQRQTQWTRDYSTSNYYPTIIDRGVTAGGGYTLQTGNILEQRDYDYGQGKPGPLLRKTDRTWLRVNPVSNTDYSAYQIYILDRPLTDTTFDANGIQKSYTKYEYDNYTGGIVASGATQHGIGGNTFGTSYMTRGNVTAVTRWRDTDGAMLVNRNVKFDDAGNVLSAIDAKGNPTTFSYADHWKDATCAPAVGASAAYVTSVVNALGQTTSFTYNSCSGTRASTADVNGQQTNWTYDSVDRVSKVSLPDGGWSCAEYSDLDVAASGCPNISMPPLPRTTVSSDALNTSMTKTSTTTLDGLGRTINQALISDTGGADNVDTTYDALGRIASVSNPYRSAANGATTYAYDALGRVTVQIQPDNTNTTSSRLQWCYDGVTIPGQSNCLANQSSTTSGSWIDYSDEAGHHWQRTTDGLGRLTNVAEPTGAATSYTYNPLGNLLQVTQAGVAGETGRSRSFTYDSLSELVCSSNPESATATCPSTASSSYIPGTVGYTYDVTGNLLSKTDARGVTTGYSYDALNRLLSKTHSDGTLASCYSYDTVVNGVGRLASEWTQARSCPTNGAAPSNPQTITSILSYDPMGRVQSQSTVAPNETSTASATYDFAGHQTSITYPDGRQVQDGFDTAGRLNAVTYQSWNGIGMNQPYLTTTNTYDPAGHLTYAIYGNGTQFFAGYDNRQRVTKLTYGPPGPLWSKQYAWTTSSNLQSQTDLVTGVQRQYNYDNLNRLTAAQDIYSNLAVASSANGNTTSTSTSGSGAEQAPGETGAIPEWTNPDDSNILPNFGEPNSNWQGTGVTLDSVTAPDGTMTGTTLLSTSSSSGIIMGGFVPDPSIYAGETMGGSVWLRSTTPTAMNVYLIGAGTANGGIVASTQAQLTTSWQQVQIRGIVQGTPTALSLQIGGGSPAVTGQNIYVWNPMVEDEGDAGTSVTNFAPYSQRFSASTWSPAAQGGVVDNAASAPDGSVTAASITAKTSGFYVADYVANPAPFSGASVTGSMWLKSSNGATFTVLLTMIEGQVGNPNVTTLGAMEVTVTPTWQRFHVSGTTQSTLSVLILQVGGSTTDGFTVGQTIDAWGAQMELASTAGPYVATDSIPASKETSLTNLLPYSEQMQYPGWQGAQNTIISTTATAPDGSLTATQISAPASGGNILVSDQAPTPELADGLPVTGSIYLKWISGPTMATVGLYTVSNAGSQYLGTTTVTLSSTWQRFQVQPPNGGNLPSGLTSLALVFGGTAGQTYQAWGAQLELASHAGPYIATSAAPIITGAQPTNVMPNSQSLNGPNWSVVAGSVTVNSDTAPDGTHTAATLNGQSWGSNNQYTSYLIANVPNPSLYDGETVTASVYLRSPSATSMTTQMYIVQSGTSGSLLNSEKTITLNSQWQRYSITATLQNGLTNVYFQFGSAATGQTMEAWGAQFVVGTDPDAYTPTPSTTTVYATGQPGTLVQTGLNQAYSYDSFGNITQNGSFESSYTAKNQMLGYAYDAAGNLLSDGMNIMTWDAESRMATAAGATYIYDAEGNRVEKQGSAVTDTVYFAGQPIARYSGGQWTDLIYGPNGLLAEVPGSQNGAPVYRATDGLGTVVGSLLANGSFVNELDHTPFGQIFMGSTSDPYIFTGKERDAESGLDYFGARYMSSNMGRFMSPDWSDDPDPIPYADTENPQSLNLYAYVNNNPLTGIDDDGHVDCQTKTQDVVCIVQTAWNWLTSRPGPQAAVGAYKELSNEGNDFGRLMDRLQGNPTLQRRPQNYQLDNGAQKAGAFIAGIGAMFIPGGGEAEGLQAVSRAGLLNEISNPALRRAIEAIYRETAAVGDGSTAAAIEEEIATGQPVGGKWHSIKGRESINRLKRILKDQSLTPRERAVARYIISRTETALGIRGPS